MTKDKLPASFEGRKQVTFHPSVLQSDHDSDDVFMTPKFSSPRKKMRYPTSPPRLSLHSSTLVSRRRSLEPCVVRELPRLPLTSDFSDDELEEDMPPQQKYQFKLKPRFALQKDAKKLVDYTKCIPSHTSPWPVDRMASQQNTSPATAHASSDSRHLERASPSRSPPSIIDLPLPPNQARHIAAHAPLNMRALCKFVCQHTERASIPTDTNRGMMASRRGSSNSGSTE